MHLNAKQCACLNAASWWIVVGGEANQNNTHCEDKAEVEHHHAIHRLDYRQTVRQFGEKNTAFIVHFPKRRQVSAMGKFSQMTQFAWDKITNLLAG